MNTHVCLTCGTQYPPADAPPASCLICSDDRQWVPIDGQAWTTYAELKRGHQNRIEEHEPGLLGIGITPTFAIAQRALLLQTAQGNVLWDCAPLIDDATVARIQALGGLRAIAISHPHYNSAVVEWSQAFGGVPIYVHADDRCWVTRHDPAYVFWEGERLALTTGVTMVRCGGHFPGSAVLHWAHGADGRGALFTGDTLHVLPDKRHVTFMHSFPNAIPLRAAVVRKVVDAIADLTFDRVYGAWFDKVIDHDASTAVRLSAERYVRALE